MIILAQLTDVQINQAERVVKLLKMAQADPKDAIHNLLQGIEGFAIPFYFY